MVIGGVMPNARAAAMLLEEVRRVGHALHAAGNGEVERTGGQRFRRHDDRLHARSADLVDRGRLHRGGQAGLHRGLAGRGLAQPGGQHAAHVDPLDVLAFHPGPFDCGLDGNRAQIRGGDFREGTRKAAHRRAGIRENHDRIGSGNLGHDGKCLSRRK